MRKYTLWTIQHEDAWMQLQQAGLLRADPDRVPEDFRRAYDWMAEQMARRIGNPPNGVWYPLWAWYRWEGKHRPRDLRCSGYGERGTPMVQMELEIEESRVLLSEFDSWHTVLSGGYLALDEADFDRFEREPGPVDTGLGCPAGGAEHPGLLLGAAAGPGAEGSAFYREIRDGAAFCRSVFVRFR